MELAHSSLFFQRLLEGHVYDVNCCRFFPSGLVVLSGGMDAQLKIWSAEDASCVVTFKGHKGGTEPLKCFICCVCTCLARQGWCSVTSLLHAVFDVWNVASDAPNAAPSYLFLEPPTAVSRLWLPLSHEVLGLIEKLINPVAGCPKLD